MEFLEAQDSVSIITYMKDNSPPDLASIIENPSEDKVVHIARRARWSPASIRMAEGVDHGLMSEAISSGLVSWYHYFGRWGIRDLDPSTRRRYGASFLRARAN